MLARKAMRVGKYGAFVKDRDVCSSLCQRIGILIGAVGALVLPRLNQVSLR